MAAALEQTSTRPGGLSLSKGRRLDTYSSRGTNELLFTVLDTDGPPRTTCAEKSTANLVLESLPGTRARPLLCHRSLVTSIEVTVIFLPVTLIHLFPASPLACNIISLFNCTLIVFFFHF